MCRTGDEKCKVDYLERRNRWPEFANLYRVTHAAASEHDRAKRELKALVPEDAREASGHGVRAKRSKSGAIRFEALEVEPGHAAV